MNIKKHLFNKYIFNLSEEDANALLEKLKKTTKGQLFDISKKLNGLFYVKSSGSFLKNLTDSDIVCYDFDGKQKDNFLKKGSMELNFHKYLLNNDDINYVCHTHPVNTLKILCSDYSEEFSEKRFFPDQIIFNGKKSLYNHLSNIL